MRALYTYSAGSGHPAYSKGSNEPDYPESNETIPDVTIGVIEPKLNVEWVPGQESRIGMSFDNPLLVPSNAVISPNVAVYEADIYYLPGADITSEGSPDTDVIWNYQTANDYQPQVWNEDTAAELARRLGVPAPSVEIVTSTEPVQNAQGIWTYHTKMTLTGVHWKFYSDACFISFTVQARNHYKTTPFETTAYENYAMPRSSITSLV